MSKNITKNGNANDCEQNANNINNKKKNPAANRISKRVGSKWFWFKKRYFSQNQLAFYMLVVTVGTLIFAGLLFNETRKSVFNQEKFSKIEMRAFIVTADTFSLEMPKVGKYFPTPCLDYKNVGKTPAYKLITEFNFSFSNNIIDFENNSTFNIRDNNLFWHNLAPNEESCRFYEHDWRYFTSDDSIKLTEIGLMYRFKILYRDIFRETHVTECIGAFIPDLGKGVIIKYIQYN